MVLAADDVTLPWTMCGWSAAGLLHVWSCVTGCEAFGYVAAQVAAGVPYVLLGGTPFWGRTEVKDVVAYLRLAVNLDDATGAPLLSHDVVAACHSQRRRSLTAAGVELLRGTKPTAPCLCPLTSCLMMLRDACCNALSGGAAALKRVINVPPRKLGAASLAGLDAWAASRGQPLGAAIFQGCQVLPPRALC
jgi:hypothetical protein